jgi:hypothetical protein
MFLNSDSIKIIDYLDLNDLLGLKKAYLQLIESGIKIDKKDIKILIKNIRWDFYPEVQENLTEIFLKYKINIPDKKKLSSVRVKKFRQKKKDDNFKNISVLLSSDDYALLQNIKIEKKLSYSALISFLLNSQK